MLLLPMFLWLALHGFEEPVNVAHNIKGIKANTDLRIAATRCLEMSSAIEADMAGLLTLLIPS